MNAVRRSLVLLAATFGLAAATAAPAAAAGFNHCQPRFRPPSDRCAR